MDVSPAMQQSIDAHLDAVEQALARGGASRHERQRVTEDLELQIREMLAARAGERPTEADVRAVLAELDPPEAYAAAGEESPGDHRPLDPKNAPSVGEEIQVKHSKLAIVGALWAPFFFIIFFFYIGYRTIAPWSAWLMLTTRFAGLLGILAPFATTILGCVAISQIRHSRGRLYGLALALADALLFPLLALDAILVAAFLFAFRLFFYRNIPEDDYKNIYYLILILIVFLIIPLSNYLLVKRIWRKISQH
jgi:hypothetical protein